MLKRFSTPLEAAPLGSLMSLLISRSVPVGEQVAAGRVHAWDEEGEPRAREGRPGLFRLHLSV